MRRQFADYLYVEMHRNPDIFLLTADLGYKMWDEIRADFPDRFVDVGAAEQLMIGAAVGLAQEGKTVLVYSITPFLLWRGAEWIRNYLNHEGANVKLVGSGRERDYSHDGFSHDATDDCDLMSCFRNIECYWPDTIEQMVDDTRKMLSSPGPACLNLRR